MKKKLFALTVMLMLLCSPALAEVEGCVSLYRMDDECILEDTIDIDGDGRQEKIFFEWYGGGDEYDTSRYIQFLPADYDGGTPHPSQDGYVYIRPGRCYNDKSGYPGNLFADGLTIYDKEYDCLSVLTGRDGVMYACVTGVVSGANGIPESFPEFFMQQGGEKELACIEVDVSGLLLSKVGSVTLRYYPANIQCKYVDALGASCFVMTQYGEDPDSDKLEICFTMKKGQTVLLGRFLNGKAVN